MREGGAGLAEEDVWNVEGFAAKAKADDGHAGEWQISVSFKS
jgi:hypothetical protein